MLLAARQRLCTAHALLEQYCMLHSTVTDRSPTATVTLQCAGSRSLFSRSGSPGQLNM